MVVDLVADTRLIATWWLRPGHRQTAENVLAFLSNTMNYSCQTC